MPLPPIVVDVAGAEQKPAMAQALLDACSRAASPTTCVTPNQADEEQAFAVAIVVWLDNGDSVRVQVGLRQGQRSGEWLTRRVQFDASDDEAERWTTTGFVVGTLAGRFIGEGEAPRAKVPAKSTQSREPAPPAPEPSPPSEEARDETLLRPRQEELFINVGGLARPQFNSGPWGLGGVLQTEYEPEGWPVFLHTGVHGSYRARDRYGVSSYFGDADVGFGVPIARLSEAWELRGTWSVGLQRMLVRVRQPASGLEDRAARWLGGGRVQFEVTWMGWQSVGAFAAIGAVWWWGSTDIEVGGKVVQEQPPLLGEATLGLRFQGL